MEGFKEIQNISLDYADPNYKLKSRHQLAFNLHDLISKSPVFEGGFINVYKDVIVFYDEDLDGRIYTAIDEIEKLKDEMGVSLLNYLIAIHEHEAGLELVWSHKIDGFENAIDKEQKHLFVQGDVFEVYQSYSISHF